MLKSLTLAVAAAAILAAVPSMAQAKSIKNLLTDQQLSNYCADKPVGSETTGTITVGDQVVTGSIHCEPEHYLPLDADGNFVSDDILDDSDDSDDDLNDDNGGDREDDDSDDDNSGSGSDDDSDDDSDNDSNDDNSGHGNSDDD